jgi:hypothetical protein
MSFFGPACLGGAPGAPTLGAASFRLCPPATTRLAKAASWTSVEVANTTLPPGCCRSSPGKKNVGNDNVNPRSLDFSEKNVMCWSHLGRAVSTRQGLWAQRGGGGGKHEWYNPLHSTSAAATTSTLGLASQTQTCPEVKGPIKPGCHHAGSQ